MTKQAPTSEHPLGRDFQFWSLLGFALPTMVMMIFMGMYTIVDTIFVSRIVGTDALSAMNIVCPVINLIVGLGTMLAAGGSAVIGQEMGAGEEARASQDFTWIICAGAVLGFLILAAGVFFLDPLVRGLGASPRLLPYCKAYLFVLLLFTPASILQVLFQNLFVTAGRPGLGMVLSVSAGMANIALDYLFMVPLRMGIAGSALGTGIGYLIPALAGLWYFGRGKGSLRFCRPKTNLSVLAVSCSNGFSEMVSQAASAVTTFFFNRIMLRLLGEDGVAAVTIMIYVQFMLTTLLIGFSMGTAPVISYAYGRKDAVRLRTLFRICLRFVAAVSVLVFVLSMGMGTPLVKVFAAENMAVREIAGRGFRIFSFGFLFCGINIFASAYFTALSNGKVSALISSMRTFVLLIFFLLTLPLFWKETGVWLAVPLSELLTVVLSSFFLAGQWRKMGERPSF